jgi:hypothetical protein
MLVSHDKWLVTQTARSLRRSLGGINEDLLIARWLKTNREFIEKFEYAYQALAFIRRKKKEEAWEDID